MSRIDGKPYAVDVMEVIAKERKRLEKKVASPEYARHPNWSWMETWLAKSDKEHYEDDFDFNSTDKNCNVCGKKGRFFMAMDFSFCDEYSCGIQICGTCLDEMRRTFAHEVLNKVRSQNEK